MAIDSKNIDKIISDKNASTQSNIGIGIQFKKLKIAQKVAFTNSKKKKILKEAKDLAGSVDTKIKSVALSKFVVRKVKKLKDLGNTKDQVDILISDIMASIDNKKEEGIISKTKTNIKGFGIDQKFIGLSVDEILKKVGAVQDKINEESSTTTDKKLTKNKKESKLDLKVNPDTDTTADVEKNNEKIYDYLLKSGETDIANYILDLMTKPEPNKELLAKKVSDIEKNTAEIKKLSVINEGISKKLDELEASMHKQDTSISIPQKLQQVSEQQNTTVEEVPKESTGFIQSILKMLFGDGILKLLMSARGVIPLAITLLNSGWKWLKDRISKLFTDMFKLAIKPIKAAITAIEEALKTILPKKVTKLSKAEKRRGGKSPEKMSDNIKKTQESLKSTKKLSTTKYKPGVIQKILKFAKPIPFIGIAASLGGAAYAAEQGYSHASDILGIPADKLTETDKLAAAAGNLVNDFSWGAIDAKSVADKVIDWSGGRPKETPAKMNKPLIMSTVKEKDANTRLDVLEQNVQYLKQQQEVADKIGDNVKSQNIQKSIDEKEKQIKSLQDELSAQKGAEKSTASKEKKLEVTEKAYTTTLNNTKAYDRSNLFTPPRKEENTFINSIGIGQQKKNTSSFDLFDNLRGN